MSEFLAKCANFVKRAINKVVETVQKWVIGVYEHAEAITVSVLAGYGAHALLATVPFLAAITLPVWIEAAMVLPVLATVLVGVLLWSAAKRPRYTKGIMLQPVFANVS